MATATTTRPTERIEAADVKTAAAGQWSTIIPAVCGIDAALLDGKHRPCPLCGGKDRFRVFDDFEQTGGMYCNQCHATGNSDGISTIMWFGGCGFSEALDKLAKHLGMATRNDQAGNGKATIVAEYDYHDADGNLLFQVVRFDPKDFRQRRPKEGGGWIWNLRGVDRVLYRLPELLADDPGQWTFAPEGEQDVDRLRSRGLSATCNSGGAEKWRDEYSDSLAGRKMAILQDNDDAGRRHVAKVAKSLAGKATSIKVIELPGLPAGGDVSDWLDAGGTVDELLAIVEATPEWEPVAETSLTIGEVADAEKTLAGLDSLSADAAFADEIIAAMATLYRLDKVKYGQCRARLPRTVGRRDFQAAVQQVAKKQAAANRKPPAEKDSDQGGLPVVVLPGGAVRVTHAATELGKLLAETRRVFLRGGAVMTIERGDDDARILQPVKAASLPAAFESVARLVKLQQTDAGEQRVPATCPESTARIVLNSTPFLDPLPPIRIVTRCAVLVERDGQLVEISDYDHRTGILAAGDPVPGVSLDDAKQLLGELVADFRFATPADRSRALASIITPAMVHGDLLGGRAAADLGEADDSQAGKGYRNKITAAVYNDKVRAITQRKGGVGGIEETFNQALIQGSGFICLDNIRGKIDSPAIESFLTEDTYWARAPYCPNVEIDPKRVFLMMTSNRAEVTRDLANRSSCTRILKQKSGYQFKRFRGGDVLDHVRGNQPTCLGAVFAIIRAWHKAGKLRTDEVRHDFRRWAQSLDWIVQEILGATPLMDGHVETQARMTNPTLNWLRDVTLAVQRAGQFGEWLRTWNLLDVISEAPEVKIPGLKEGGDLDDEAARKKVLQAMGRNLKKCFAAVDAVLIDGLKIEKRESTDEEWRTKQEYRFTEGLVKTEKCVFPDNPLTPYGNPIGQMSDEKKHTGCEKKELDIGSNGSHRGLGGTGGEAGEQGRLWI